MHGIHRAVHPEQRSTAIGLGYWLLALMTDIASSSGCGTTRGNREQASGLILSIQSMRNRFTSVRERIACAMQIYYMHGIVVPL
jgi:hypothetical protein